MFIFLVVIVFFVREVGKRVFWKIIIVVLILENIGEVGFLEVINAVLILLLFEAGRYCNVDYFFFIIRGNVDEDWVLVFFFLYLIFEFV